MPVASSITSREDFAQLLEKVARMLAGKEPDVTGGMVYALQVKIGVMALSLIKAAFVQKSKGLTGDDGIKWKSLSPKTIAMRRQGKIDKQKMTVASRAVGLTDSQKRRMARDITAYQAQLMVRFGFSKEKAKGLARSHVENRWRRHIQVFGQMYRNDPLKVGYGDLTKFRPAAGMIYYKYGYLSSRIVEILRDTGLTLQSLSPGVAGPSTSPDQIFQTPPGHVIVGTSRNTWHHLTSGLGRLPKREFWPDVLPDAWQNALLNVLQKGIVEIVTILAK